MVRREEIATLGDALGLFRYWVRASASSGGRFDVAAYEIGQIFLNEVDEQGRCRRSERFGLDRLGDAAARLYGRYAELLPDGPARKRAVATARSVGAMLGAFESERWAAACAPEIEGLDHRSLATHSARGAPALLQGWRAWLDLAAAINVCDDEILALQTDALLLRRTFSGTDRASGGRFERPMILLLVFGRDGLVTRIEWFEADRDTEALVRFEELSAVPSPVSPRIENAATLATQRFLEAWQAHDWGHLTTLAGGFRHVDRRRLVQLELGGDEWLASYRRLVSMTSSIREAVLATRGERLAMMRIRWEGSDRSTGPSEIESLAVVEVDGHGDTVAVVEFDPDDLVAAHAELDARYAAGEAATHPPVSASYQSLLSAYARRDWDAVGALFATDVVGEDHRLLGFAPARGRQANVRMLQALVELAPDVRLGFDHVCISDRAAFLVGGWRGTREGGAIEIPWILVPEFDALGRVQRFDQYALEQLDEARARFEALSASAPRDPLAALATPNAASAWFDRLQGAFEARDWGAVRSLATEGARFEDRRRHAQVSYDVDGWVTELKLAAEARVENVHFQLKLVATAGDRICLARVLSTGGPAGGRVEIEHLGLVEVDESGRLICGVLFDPEDLRAASRDAWGRWIARDALVASVLGPTLEAFEAFNDRDRARMRAVLADDVVFDDRRLVGAGRIAGADASLDSAAVLWDLAPDIQLHLPFVLAIERHGSVGVGWSFGTVPGGGAFERYEIGVCTVARGRVTRLETFEIDDADAALAHFAKLRPDPLRIPPNAATRATDHFVRCMSVRDWDALRALYAPTMVFDDRRRLVRTTGDREMFIENCRLIARSGTQLSRTPLATAGDRLSLERLLWTGEHHGGAFETEALNLIEVNAEGRCVAVVTFDPHDRRAAARELLDRWARSDAARGLPALAVMRSVVDRDLDRVRAELPAGFVFHDHRRTGAGRLEGGDDYVAWLAALLELSPDAIIEPLYYVAVERHAFLAVAHCFGTLAEGGEFESVFVQLAGRGRGEVFELDDLDLARERFEELVAARRPLGSDARSE